MRKFFLLLIAASFLIMPADCYPSMLSFMERAHSFQKAAIRSGFKKEYIKSGDFSLLTYSRINKSNENIRIYIEGDGRAWETRKRLSSDPTPSDPIALNLSVIDASQNVAYIARPGQFPAPDFPVCDPVYWSQKRFAPEVADAINKTIDVLKEKALARSVELVGYSGGGALTVLVAARRGDVSGIRTVAGNLDPKALCAYHNVSQLEGSLDPLDVAQKVANIPQRHFVGSNDKVVPVSIAESFVKKEGDVNYNRITIVDGVTHNKGWREHWKELLSMPLSNQNP